LKSFSNIEEEEAFYLTETSPAEKIMKSEMIRIEKEFK